MTTTTTAWLKAAAAAALLLATAVPATAQAPAQPPPATGTFFYHSPQSGDLELDTPDDGECYLLLQGADRASNRTDKKATLFYERDCEGTATTTLRPAQSATYGSNLPHSVRFG